MSKDDQDWLRRLMDSVRHPEHLPGQMTESQRARAAFRVVSEEPFFSSIFDVSGVSPEHARGLLATHNAIQMEVESGMGLLSDMDERHAEYHLVRAAKLIASLPRPYPRREEAARVFASNSITHWTVRKRAGCFLRIASATCNL